MDKEQWKNEIMDSLKGIRPAEPNPFLFTRIEARLRQRVSPRQWKIAIAVSAVLLIANAWILIRDSRSTQSAPSAYEFNNHRYQLY